MLDEEFKNALTRIKNKGNRSEHLANVGRLLYAYFHKFNSVTEKGLDDTPAKVVTWWIQQQELTEEQLYEFKCLCIMTMNISNKYAKIQKWSKGSKAILVTIFNTT